jgi:hypothetical protein
MEEQLFALLRKLPLDAKTLRALVPLAGKFGASGINAVARAYLGDLAEPAGPKPCAGDKEPSAPPPVAVAAAGEPPTDANTAPPPVETKRVGATADGNRLDTALVGRALHKLVYELGELALHNPGVDPGGKLPTYQRDEKGALPSVSVAHALAAKRWYDQRQAAAAPRDTSPRGRLVAARSERYAAAPRYSYVAPTSSRGPR